jgi:signal transduction histidine kinase/ActR/RegA family two-component response regulator
MWLRISRVNYSQVHPVQSKSVIENLMHHSDAGIIIIDENFCVIEWNELASQIVAEPSLFAVDSDMFGYPVDSLIVLRQHGKPVKLREIIQSAVSTGSRREYTSGLVALGPTKEITEVRLVVYPVPFSDRTPGVEPKNIRILAVLLLEFIAEKRRIRRDLQNLQHADDIRRVATGIAHEMNNGSTTVLTELDRLQRIVTNTGSGDTAVNLSNIRSAAEKMMRLGLQLEQFSRRGTVLNQEPRETENLSDVAEVVHETVSMVVSGGVVNTTFIIDSAVPPAAIPASELTHALFNVVLNALEAMSDDGTLRIEVRGRPGDDSICLVVKDDGTGMDPHTARNAFRPYFSTKPTGIGMGLTMSMSILAEFGGSLVLETEPGFGTTATIRVPAVQQSDQDDEQVQCHEEGGPVILDNVRVLMVEDDPLVRRSMELMMSGMGCDVTAVQSGERALDVFRRADEQSRPFDILVTDLTMPGRVNGIQLVHRLRELSPDLPAVLSSGALHRTETAGYRDAGFQYVLRKPFGEREIREALSTALDAHRRCM